MLVALVALAALVVVGVALANMPARTGHTRPPGDGPFALPRGFLWGAATADQQIEHQQPSDWTAFENLARRERRQGAEPGHIKGIADVADHVIAKKSDFDRKFADDFALAAAMGHNAHRFSISWARMFPREDMSDPDPAALDFYGRVLDALEKNGLLPFVTLFHFASPAWLWTDSGGRRGVEREDAVARFSHFVDAVVKHFGARVRLWCTLNEPMVFAYAGYLQGIFPPHERRGGPEHVVPVVVALLKMHAAAYALIHGARSDAQVGIAQHVRAFVPWRNLAPLDRITAQLIDRAFILDFLDAIHTGKLDMAMTGQSLEIPGLASTMDYVGVNHYGRAYVKTRVNAPQKYEILFHDPDEPGEEWSDLGWAADEAALTRVLTRFHARYARPLYVLENGVADAAPDDLRRQRLLVRHAHAIWVAVQQGADVRGYFHWSLVDNFEWAEGFDPRFGLYAIDYERDFVRTPRASVDVYRAIAQANAVSAELWRKHRR